MFDIIGRSKGMVSRNKLTSIFVVLLMIVSLLSAAFFISKNIHHDCCGNDCQVCEEIQLAEAILTKVIVFVAISHVFFTLISLCSVRLIDYSIAIIYKSPILLKVKLLN